MIVARYLLETGRILDVGKWTSIEDATSATDASIAGVIAAPEGADPAMQYVAAGALATRQPSPGALDKVSISANGTDVATLSGIPAGAVLTITDLNGPHAYTVADGQLLLTATAAQVIALQVEAFPYLPWQGRVVAS